MLNNVRTFNYRNAKDDPHDFDQIDSNEASKVIYKSYGDKEMRANIFWDHFTGSLVISRYTRNGN